MLMLYAFRMEAKVLIGQGSFNPGQIGG
jgi:hypothetical protein